MASVSIMLIFLLFFSSSSSLCKWALILFAVSINSNNFLSKNALKQFISLSKILPLSLSVEGGRLESNQQIKFCFKNFFLFFRLNLYLREKFLLTTISQMLRGLKATPVNSIDRLVSVMELHFARFNILGTIVINSTVL